MKQNIFFKFQLSSHPHKKKHAKLNEGKMRCYNLLKEKTNGETYALVRGFLYQGECALTS